MILVSNNVARGYSLEYYVARELACRHSVNIVEDDSFYYRKRIAREYESTAPYKARKLNELALKVVNNIPRPFSDISFVHSSFNHGEVYDVIYQDKLGEDVKISVKTKNMEDKAYRFSTKRYILVEVQSYLQQLFSNFSETYAQALSRNSMSTTDLAKDVVLILQRILLDENHPDHNTFVSLIENSFIGNGDFYRNDKYGNVVYFPENPHNGLLEIDKSSVAIKRNHLIFNVTTYDDFKNKIQDYNIDIRLKFKDGQSKIVSYTPEGYVRNYAATVKVNMI